MREAGGRVRTWEAMASCRRSSRRPATSSWGPGGPWMCRWDDPALRRDHGGVREMCSPKTRAPLRNADTGMCFLKGRTFVGTDEEEGVRCARGRGNIHLVK